jgi:hypothetical protein
MSAVPQIKSIDGPTYSSQMNISTNSGFINLEGIIDKNSIDVQININESGFISDPTLFEFSSGSIRIPNLSSLPDGIPLDRGKNSIRIRTIGNFGEVSPEASIFIDYNPDSSSFVSFPPPTGVQAHRFANKVEIRWSNPSNESKQSPFSNSASFPDPFGFNVYASTSPSGTGSGYLKINRDIIQSSSPFSKNIVEDPILEESYDIEDDGNSNLVVTSILRDQGGKFIDQKSQNIIPLVLTPNARLRVSVSGIREERFYSFSHNRADGIGNGIINNDIFGSVPNEEPIFYVVTALYSDLLTGQIQESRYSSELSSSPLPLDTNVRGINIRDRKKVAEDYIGEVQKSTPTLSLIPGSTVREVHIEPFSNEIQKAYFLTDFVHRAKSFSALLQIDDPNLTGVSVPYADSSYKQQLGASIGISSDIAVQSLINGAFDSLAKNYSRNRRGSKPATVSQTFYTNTKPVRDLTVNQNAIITSSSDSNSPRFRVRGQAQITAVDSQRFYNSERKRYEIKVDMVAERPGSDGNVPAGSLDVIVSGAQGFKTINENSASFGRDAQSNLELAEECIRSNISLDTGTEGGYSDVGRGLSGVVETKIVKSGDSLMMRDFDSVRGKHIGGKVDIYVKGTVERTIQEPFAFQFDIARNVRFDVIDSSQLIFRARDSRLTSSNPISEILYNPSQNFGIRNHSNLPTDSYDLTGIIILDFRTVKLNSSIPQPETHIDDFIEGDYRYRSNNKFVASVQPIRRVSSVVGEVSGSLDQTNGYSLFKLEDPLLEGESTISKDFIVINQVEGVPTGNSIQINSEEHTLIGQFEESLNSVGINSFTVRVFSRDRQTIYNGPSSLDPDYLIIGGSQISPIKIIRTTSSQIPSGGVVSVDYEHDENFTVTYVVNDVLQNLQNSINSKRHVTADVLVKQAVENPLALSATVQLKPNAVQSTQDKLLKTSISNLIDAKKIGIPIYQSDITSYMKLPSGVDFIVQPFSKMTLRDESRRIREKIPSDFIPIPSLSSLGNQVFILTQSLSFNTIDTGGNIYTHKGVFKDGIQMDQSLFMNQVGMSLNSSFIIGKDGAVIDGYSDDATLLNEFGNDTQAITVERIQRTSNRVLISLKYDPVSPDTPDLHGFSVTYSVYKDSGTKDVILSEIEYATPGDIVLTYKNSR